MKGRSKFWGEFQYVSAKQIELALSINAYRRQHNMNQTEFAHICNLYGEPHGVKFAQTEISTYELMKTAPRKARFQVLCNVLNLKNKN